MLPWLAAEKTRHILKTRQKKQDKLSYRIAGRLFKSLFFYCGFIVIIFLVITFVFVGQGEMEEVVFGGDIFDVSQYLFGEQSKISANISMGITGGSVLEPAAPPFLVSGNVLGALSGVIEPEIDKEIIKYVVKEGDTLSSIADSFNISLETLYWANNLGSRSVLRIGQELNILPVSGLLHIVRQGDTVSEIAQLYSVKSDAVIDFFNRYQG